MTINSGTQFFAPRSPHPFLIVILSPVSFDDDDASDGAAGIPRWEDDDADTY